MRVHTRALLGILLLPCPLLAQAPAPSLQDQLRAAEQPSATSDQLFAGSAAARTLKDFKKADSLWASAAIKVGESVNTLISTALSNELASGRGVPGAQRFFRQARARFGIGPVDVANWSSTLGFPEILVGGEYDDLIKALAADAADPRYRCACYTAKAWMYRVGGDMPHARVYWDSAMIAAARNPPPNTAQARINLARDLARAGRTEEARRAAQAALAADKWETLNGVERRRWAQYHAEVGEVDKTIEILEGLLAEPTLETIVTIEDRVTWDPIREQPAFKAFLSRHR